MMRDTRSGLTKDLISAPSNYSCCDVGCSSAILCRDGKPVLLSNPRAPKRQVMGHEGTVPARPLLVVINKKI
jgi:hypothetical protein